MAQDLVLHPAGLWTNPSAYSAVPPGALDEAENVVIRRPGIVECRPGFPQFNPASLDASVSNALSESYGLIDYPGTLNVIVVGEPASGSADTTYAVDGATDPCIVITEPSGDPLTWTRPYIFGAAARKNLYLSTSDAVRKVAGISAVTTAARAGTPPPFLIITDDTSTGGIFAQGSYVSYRAVKVRKDENGVITRSAPSNRVIYGNLDALSRSPVIRIFQHENDDNDPDIEMWELYRSFVSTSADVPDEHFFVRAFGPYPTDTNLTTAYGDRTPDSELGAPLYTNDDEEGLENANQRPPQAKVVAEFAGSVALADLTFPAQMLLTYQYTDGLTGADAAGIGERDLTGTYTNGDATVTGVADTSGFKVGMIIVDTAGEWGNPSNGEFTRVTATTANSVTFNQVYNGVTGAKTRVLCDSIRVGARYFPVREQFELGVVSFWNSFSEAGETYRPSSNVYALTEDASIAVQNGGMTWSGPTNRTLALQAILPTDAPFVVYATHGDEYDPPLPEPTATGATATQETAPGGILWSKVREPEHFSFVDYEQLGGESAKVLSLCKGGDGLWVLKEDGIYRMSGADRNSGFRFDRVSSARVLGPKAAVESGDRAFAWCDQGLMALTSGVAEISTLAVSDVLRGPQAAVQSDPDVVNTAAFVSTNLKTNEIIVSRLTQASGYADSPTVLVYNLETTAWTEWELFGGVSSALYSQDLGLLFGGISSVPLVMKENNTAALAFADEVVAFTCTVANDVDVTITGGSYPPIVGDIVQIGAVYTSVVAVTDSTHFTVADTVVGTSGNGHRGISCRIGFRANTAKNPSALKLWGQGSILLGDLQGPVKTTLEFESSAQASGAGYNLSSTLEEAALGRSVRFITPRACARSEQLYVTVTFYAAVSQFASVGSNWRLEGLSLSYKPMSLRTRS